CARIISVQSHENKIILRASRESLCYNVFVKKESMEMIGLIVFALSLLIIAVLLRPFVTLPSKQSASALPPNGPISIQGEMVCLPHLDTSGPQTMECAFGLKDELGRYFGLSDTDPEYKNIAGVPMQTHVEVEGEFTARNDTTYRSTGTIKVYSIHITETPKRATLTGTYMCLPTLGASTTS